LRKLFLNVWASGCNMTSGQQGLRSGATGLAAEKTAKILVVDDEDIIRVLLDEILSEEGYQVFQATDGR
jgi:PleD family two-component response regulator